jgi:polysaccharide export outer membrane protein
MASMRIFLSVAVLAGTALTTATAAAAQQTRTNGNAAPAAAAVVVPVPNDFVLGPEDVIGVLFWREADISGDVTVRPDGIITVPLIGEVKAAGVRPDALREQIQEAAAKYLTDANVAVVVRQINSRKVFITGQVGTPGAYPLTGPRTVMQLIALAGGLIEYADAENITIMRQGQQKTQSFKFNYKDVAKGKKLEQNIALQPGDTVVVP